MATTLAMILLNIIITIVLVVYILVYAVILPCLHSLKANANHNYQFFLFSIQQCLYYICYLSPLFVYYVFAQWQAGVISSMATSLIVIAIVVYVYLVAIRAEQIKVRHQQLDLNLTQPTTLDSTQTHHSQVSNLQLSDSQGIRLIVVSNIKMGLFSSKIRQINRLVNIINQTQADGVVIIGDWLYYPSADLLGQLVSIKGIHKPVFTVLGKQDLDYDAIQSSLPKHEMALLNDNFIDALQLLDVTDVRQQTGKLELSSDSDSKHKLANTSILLSGQAFINSDNPQFSLTAGKPLFSLEKNITDGQCYIQIVTHSDNIANTSHNQSTHTQPKQMPQVVIRHGFGKTGLPIWLYKPSITVLHIR